MRLPVHPRMSSLRTCSAYDRAAGGNIRRPHRLHCGSNGPFLAPNGLLPVLLSGGLVIVLLTSLIAPWTQITEIHLLPDGSSCGFREMRSWSHIYCRHTSHEPICQSYYADVVRQHASTDVRTGTSECIDYDWREIDRDNGSDNQELASVYTLPAVFVGGSLLCALAVLIGFLVRCIGPEEQRQRSHSTLSQWHVIASIAGAFSLIFALTVFAAAHAAAYQSYVERALGGGACITGPCSAFAGTLEQGAVSLQWGPMGWTWAMYGLGLYCVLAYYARAPTPLKGDLDVGL